MNPLKSDVLAFAPNRPVTVALVNPEGLFDFEVGIGLYETTAGQTFTLPRPAVVILNQLDPEPGEEITITKHWSGKRGDKAEWTISLSPQAEKARARAEETGQEPPETPETVDSPTRPRKEPTAPPTPIRRPSKRAPAPEIQPRLFDRGTGTHGPAPLPALSPAAHRKPEVIPWNIAFREVSMWVSKELAGNNLQWSDEAQQAMCCTVLIQEARAGRVGLWERS